MALDVTPRDPLLPEFSRLIDAPAVLAAGGASEHLSANDGERAALARRLGLVSIASLEATLELRTWRGCGLEVEGVLKARVVQSCVVSLEPIESMIETVVLARYLPSAMNPSDSLEMTEAALDPFATEPPETLPQSGRLDLGELVTQHLAIAVDPYPRRPDAEFAGHIEKDAQGEGGPFAKLAALKPRPKE